jgi:hypothetical protein
MPTRSGPRLCVELLESRLLLDSTAAVLYPIPPPSARGDPAPPPAHFSQDTVANLDAPRSIRLIAEGRQDDRSGTHLVFVFWEQFGNDRPDSREQPSGMLVIVEETWFTPPTVEIPAKTVVFGPTTSLDSATSTLESGKEHVSTSGRSATDVVKDASPSILTRSTDSTPRSDALALTASEAAHPDRSSQQTPHVATESPIGVGAEQAALLAQGLTGADRRVGEKLLAGFSNALPTVEVLPGSASARPGGNEASAVPRASGSDRRICEEEIVAPEAIPAPRAEALPAEGAGLLTEGMSFGLATLERAVRAWTQQESSLTGRGVVLLRWLGLCSWALGAALVCIVARRGRSQPLINLHGADNPWEEELP